MLAALPIVGNSCPCSPPPNAPVIATTTALTFPTADTSPGLATICIVRVLVSLVVAADANRNGVVDLSDETFVSSDPRFNSSLTCAPACGSADVNLDGFINTEDINTIRQVCFGCVVEKKLRFKN
jgi:hypothetical protein